MGTQLKWVRANDGLFAGVCKGLGRSFEVDPWILRAIWLVSFFCFGTGLVIYLLLALCLPREDRVSTAHDKKLLGVCAQLSTRVDIEVGLLRFVAVLLSLGSFGVAAVVYVILSFLLPKESASLSEVTVSSEIG